MEYLKLNQDQILEVITEYYAEQLEYETFSSKIELFGLPGQDLRAVVVFGSLDELDEVNEVNMEDVEHTAKEDEVPEWAWFNSSGSKRKE